MPVTAVYRVSLARMAADAASRTAWGGGKSGSPTQRDVTSIPSASICLTLENTWMVADTLTLATSGLTAMGFGFEVDSSVDVDADNLVCEMVCRPGAGVNAAAWCWLETSCCNRRRVDENFMIWLVSGRGMEDYVKMYYCLCNVD